MAIEHVAITNPNIHEPKNIATAALDTVYHADGAGSGTFKKPGGNNTVIVNSMSDFPAAVAGVRTLVSDTLYSISAELTTTDRFVLAEGVTIEGQSSSGVGLTYTGTDTMFTGVDVSCQFHRARISSPTGKTFDISDTVGGLRNFLFINSVVLVSTDFGSFSDLSVAQFQSSGTGIITQGAQFSGSNWNIIAMNDFGLTSLSATFVGMDLGTAVSPRISISNLIVTAPAGAIGVKGAASSANLPTGAIGSITDCLFIGGLTTPLSGIDGDSIRWDLDGNSPNVQDTMPDALASLVSNATNTVIAGSSTPALVAGTWTDAGSSQFTVTAAGRITYVGERDITTPVDVVLSMEPVSGANKNIAVQIFKNGSLITGTLMQALTDNGDPLVFKSMWQLDLVQNDFLEVFISNETDGVDILVNDAIFRVR